MIKKINNYISTEIHTISNLDINKINSLYQILDDCLNNNKKVYIFGNGGSASTASHMANDFNKAIFNNNEHLFNFICLNDNIPTLLAIANDETYDEVFRYQLQGRITKNDVVIAISGSGNSKNIINACTYAKDIGTTIIGFTGYDGGKLKQISNLSIDTNINNMQITEDIHLLIEHLLISIFYQNYGQKEYKKKTLTKERRNNNE